MRGAGSLRNQVTEGQIRITLDDPSEILVLRPNGTIKAYQKGFTKAELKGWCEKELGDGYSVEVANSKNAARMILLWLLLKITKATLLVLLPGLPIQVG